MNRNEAEFISGELQVTGNVEYETVIFQDEACLCLGTALSGERTEQRIKIGTLIQDSKYKPAAYAFKCSNPENRKVSITIEIDDLQTDIQLLCYGRDGRDGKDGTSGGDGADSYFSSGGSGGNGGSGTDGEDGKDCPDIVIRYGSSTGNSLSWESRPGKGGKAGKGGKGGEGGLGSDRKTRAGSGQDGQDGRAGRDGRNGAIEIIHTGGESL